MDATQAAQLSTVHAVLTRKLPDGSGATTPDQIWQRNLDVSRRTLAALTATSSAQAAALETLAKSVGVDPAVITKTVAAAVDRALADVELTLTPKES